MIGSDPRSDEHPAGRNAELVWLKSTLSQTGDCVEWALDSDEKHMLVRDSKDPNGSRLCFTLSEWRAFVGGVVLGEATL